MKYPSFEISYDYGEVIVKLKDGTELGKGGLNEFYGDGYLLELELNVKRGKLKLAKGSEVFQAIFDTVAQANNNITGIKGMWYPALPDNLNAFNKAIRNQVNKGLMTLEEAALNHTFTGIMAQRNGFKRVIMIQGKQKTNHTFEYINKIIFSI